MKLSLYIASLLTITCSMQYASSAALEQYQNSWTDNPQLASTISVNGGIDGYAICAYSEVSDRHKIYPLRTGPTLNFGFAIVPRHDLPAKSYLGKDMFCKHAPRNIYFHVQEDDHLSKHGHVTTVGAYAFANLHNPCRFLFICSNLDTQFEIHEKLKTSPELTTLAAASAYVRSQLPRTTFVLFDLVEYYNNLVKPKF